MRAERSRPLEEAPIAAKGLEWAVAGEAEIPLEGDRVAKIPIRPGAAEIAIGEASLQVSAAIGAPGLAAPEGWRALAAEMGAEVALDLGVDPGRLSLTVRSEADPEPWMAAALYVAIAAALRGDIVADDVLVWGEVDAGGVLWGDIEARAALAAAEAAGATRLLIPAIRGGGAALPASEKVQVVETATVGDAYVELTGVRWPAAAPTEADSLAYSPAAGDQSSAWQRELAAKWAAVIRIAEGAGVEIGARDAARQALRHLAASQLHGRAGRRWASLWHLAAARSWTALAVQPARPRFPPERGVPAALALEPALFAGEPAAAATGFGVRLAALFASDAELLTASETFYRPIPRAKSAPAERRQAARLAARRQVSSAETATGTAAPAARALIAIADELAAAESSHRDSLEVYWRAGALARALIAASRRPRAASK